ncbi:ferredoxin reductase [Aeromicrobium sp. UC242_57]|uniref:ferredoxin reductase n=1 Tax=Aeromicrobium sp. UC242_57 TaxID=3374624 RepID=UPI00379B1CF2
MARSCGSGSTCAAARGRASRPTAVSPQGIDLPLWKAGDHVDIHLPSGTTRQYSLCGDPADAGRWRIGVLEQPSGRGGSVEAHRELRPGVVVGVGQPRREFGLADGSQHLFVAGGIGITPILPMLREAEARGDSWTLVYGARSRDHFAFLGEPLPSETGCASSHRTPTASSTSPQWSLRHPAQPSTAADLLR